MATPQAQYEKMMDEYRKIQNDISTTIESRQKLESQLQENKIVQKEFSVLDEDSKIYKLIGPVLVPQDRPEAVMNVDKRLEFIESEIKRVENQIKDTQSKADKQRSEILAFQAKIQESAGGPAPIQA
ncbi:Prefoldin [Kockiozyma suomiensis]|uniref:Prefoldin n=1 Tax=Kockiozyma suomiensis TaxID=1337062 RepID=UPI003343A8CC